MKLLKLGGSVVTKKDLNFTPNLEQIRRLAEEIKDTLPQKLIIIHGGGSFGHPVAKDYSINQGYRSPDQLIGFSKTHESMVKLNQIIVNEFHEIGVPVFGVSPSSYIITNDKRIKKLDIRILEGLLNLGTIPILYGDAVLDKKLGFTILSGDQLAVEIAKKLNISTIIFGSDLDGIFTTDPKIDSKAVLLERLSIDQMEVNSKITGSQNTDVTGGMLGKISEASEAVRVGMNVMVVNALEPGRVKKAILGEKVKGTYIVP
jgi:isopentenyl phosphate kinase